MATIKRTPLYEEHLKAEAKVIDFGGWEMPVQYAGILEEHRTVRNRAGLFDVSHMGEIEVRGVQALDLVNQLITNDAAKLADNQILYSPMCNDQGGIVDDLLVYRYTAEHFLLVVNASNTDKDYAWMLRHSDAYDAQLTDISAGTAQLALQGPLAQDILQTLTPTDLSDIKYYWFAQGKVAGVDCLISRTGYTGEDGFELYFAPQFAVQLWQDILVAGKPVGVEPIGLGARDTLRFEACLPLYGNELGENISPLEAGLGMFVQLGKADFVGKHALEEQKADGINRKIVGFAMLDRGIPRSHYPVAVNGQEIGFVTSGSYSPSLDKNIGLGLVDTKFATVGQEIEVIVRGKGLKAKIVPKPFYRRQR
ncbi:MAG: glycine cleavage system aminomethyltransferase GcvT [Peptococcaceae bacterium]|nr:glycine cleavage system aminomethyltransferase GcvT [Peptococcaceae bacterium]